MNPKLLPFKYLCQQASFGADSFLPQEIELLLQLAPKNIDGHYMISNNSFEIICLLIKIDIKSQCAFPKITSYLLDLAKGIFGLKAINQYYHAKVTTRLDLLEFDVINKVNQYLLDILNLETIQNRSSLIETIRQIINETYIPKLSKLISQISNHEKSLEESFKNDNVILWFRSFLQLPMRNSLFKFFATEEIKKNLNEELGKMMKIPISQQMQDGFYKTGVILHMFPFVNLDLNELQFLSNYTNTLIKKYFKFEEVNQKLLNPFRLALEVSISFQDSFEGYMLETSKTLSLRKLLKNFLTELQGISENFYVKFMNDILKSIEITFWRIPSIQEKVKVLEVMFNYYMKCKSFSENVQQMIGESKPTNLGKNSILVNFGDVNNGLYQTSEKKKEETMHRIITVSELVLNSIFKILDQENFDSALVDYNNSLAYNFIVHVFNSLCWKGKGDLSKLDDGEQLQPVKDPRKYEIYGFKFLYNLVKKFRNTRINELIYNLISSRFSLKVSLNELKNVFNSLEEKSAQKLLIKMKLQMSLNIIDNKLFQKSMNELVSYYSEIIEEPKYKLQEAFVYSLFKNLINRIENEDKMFIFWNQLTAFMIRLGKEVTEQTKQISFIQYFAKNLECIKDLLMKSVIKKTSGFSRDPKFIERLIEIWINIIFHKQTLLQTSQTVIEDIALSTPRLIQASATSYTNTFLINTFLNQQKIIDKYRRNMKHVLREKMIELRPKIRNLTLGEMMFLLSIDFILDVKIKEVARNHKKILEFKKDIPLIEMIFCYVRDVYITEKENLKEVLEELLIRKARLYLSQLLLVNDERLQMNLVEKDFVAILQSSCSINRIYLKISQIFLKEFIREFPRLIFQEIAILSLSETLEFLYKRVLQQYDSVSSRLKISHYNLRIAIPDTLKDLNDLLVFLLACTHNLCLRGYLIEGTTLLKRVNDVLTLPQHKHMKYSNLILQYFFWSLNNHPSLSTDVQLKGPAYWFFDKPYFLNKVDRFENKHLDEGLKVISVIPPFSFEIHFDSKLAINSLNQILREFKFNSGNQIEMQIFKEKTPSFSKVFDDLKISLIQFYIFNAIQREKNYKLHLSELLKDPLLLKAFDKEAKEIISTTSRNANIFEKLKIKMDETFANIVTNLHFAVLYMKSNPNQTFQILTKIYSLVLSLPVRRILKFVIKKLTKNILISVPNKYSSDVLRALFYMLQEIIFRYNSFTNISATTKSKFFEFDLLEVNSDIFSRIKYKDLVSHNLSHLGLHEKLCKNFFSYNEGQGLFIKQVRSLFSIRHFIQLFNSLHKDVLVFVYNNLSVFLANLIDPFEIIVFLRENFDIIRTSIEFFKDENIFAMVSAHLAVLNLSKNSPLSTIEKRFLQKFYSKSLKFALSYFAKNSKFYVDEAFESEEKILKIEKKMDLALKACRHLKLETFMETTLTIEKMESPIKFPPVFIDLNILTPSKTKLLFKFKDSRSFWFFEKLKSRSVGSLGYSKLKSNISVIYDPSNEKKQILPNISGLNRYQNLRKLLLLLIGHQIDTIKAFNKTELGLIKYEFTLEDKVMNETEAKQLLYFAFDINIHLAVYIIKRLVFTLPSPFQTPQTLIRDLVTKYYLFNFQYQILFEYFVEKNLQNISTLRNLFYWEVPQFPLLMKYMTIEFEGQKTLSIYFTKTVKRLESTQLLFYLPQIYQTLNTEASYLVAQTLKEYSQTSYLFSHQLIWKTKVESKREKNETGNSKLSYISWQLLYQLLKGLNRTEKFLFKQVDDFFEAVTAISGILQPKMPKKQKEEIIQAELEKIVVSEYLYVPSNPQYMISKIKLDSGRAMQSAAKCPILVSFYCKRFEGPDKYYPKLLNKNIGDNNQKDSEEDLLIDNEVYPSINDLKLSGRVKLLPKESLTGSINQINQINKNGMLEKIYEKNEEIPPDQERIKILEEIEQQKNKVSLPDPNLIPTSVLEEVGTNTKKEHPTSFNFAKENNQSFEKLEEEEKDSHGKDDQDLSKNERRLENSGGTSNILPPIGEIQREELPIVKNKQKSHKHSLHNKKIDHKEGVSILQKEKNEKTEEAQYDIISCIFKVFDDIRQDELALQVINLFKHIFRSVGLDLFLFPYRTISNRTGKDLDIGGIIEVVPNTISRDQMGKIMNCNLYEYFIARFGSEMSPEFQLARENFIKSMAAYSIVSYILQIKDRHNGNILIDAYGHIVHIDFGFIFDISPAHNMKFESANFKLTKEMIQIMGGSQITEPFNYYVDQTIKAFLVVRRFEDQIFNMIKLMSYSGLKCFRPMSLQNLKDRFMPKLNELQSATMMKRIILDAYDKLTTNLYDDIQHLQNKIHR